MNGSDLMLKELSDWDFPDTELVPEGPYDLTSVPKMSDRNFRILIEEHNMLVKAVNILLYHSEIEL